MLTYQVTFNEGFGGELDSQGEGPYRSFQEVLESSCHSVTHKKWIGSKSKKKA